MDLHLLTEDLKRDEGLRLKPYRDTMGKLTIGVGRNLDDVGISQAEADMLLQNDLQQVIGRLDRAFAWYGRMSERRQRALANMAFNMGITKLTGFRKMLDALSAGDYTIAANEALSSAWAQQVGARAQRIAVMIREG